MLKFSRVQFVFFVSPLLPSRVLCVFVAGRCVCSLTILSWCQLKLFCRSTGFATLISKRMMTCSGCFTQILLMPPTPPPPPKKKSQVNLNNWDDHTFSIWLVVVFMFFMFLSVLFGAVVSTVAISAMEVKCQKPRGCLLVKCTASWLARWLHYLRFLIPIVQDLLDRNDQTSTYGWDIQELNC